MATGIAWLTAEEMADHLRVGEESHGVIEALAAAVPAYVETTTGYPAELTAGEDPNEVVKQLARFLIALWFNPDGSDARQLRQVVNSLTYAAKAMVSTEESNGE